MKVAIYYFSGTGNTELTCKKWASEAKSRGITIDLFKMEEIQDQEIDLSGYDKVGIGYPIHGFNAPKIVLEFTKKVKPSEEMKPLFIIMVSGEYMTINHSSALKLESILKKKNFYIESDYHYLMPYNMIFRHTELRAFKMYETMNALVPLDVEDYLVNNKPHHLAKHKFIRPVIWVIRIEHWFAHVNGKHYKVDMNKCIKCMRCVNSCPTKNIEFKDGKFTFKNSCLCCTRCSFYCPSDAFKIALLNGWRVNKPYRFKEPEEVEVDKHPRYCKKSYIRYYQEAENRLNKASE